MKLNGHQYEQLTLALLDAFPRLSNLEQMLKFRLDKNLHEITISDSLKEMVFRLIQAAEAEAWTIQLVAAARESNPSNPKLLTFSQQFGLTSTNTNYQELERTIKHSNSFLDVELWRTRLGQVEGQVCRIEIQLNGGKYHTFGTGFLLGSNVLMTNYHVMESVINTELGKFDGTGFWATPSNVTLRFDYKRTKDGEILNPGTLHYLAKQDWLIDYSRLSSVDHMLEPQSSVPQLDELDYALLRLDSNPGYEAIGQNPEPGAPKRGWIELPNQACTFDPNTPLLIMQHPEGLPLKLAFDTEAIIGVNSNKTRLMYRTNTEKGSSGSPCFNIYWDLIALHHSGDPNFDPNHKPTYNQGIPFTTILELLEIRGYKSLLGK